MVFVNEIDYVGSSSADYIELAGNAGESVNGHTLYVYNSDGTVAYSQPLFGTFADQGDGGGVQGLNADLPDSTGAIAIAETATGNLVEFVSYGGTVTGTAGPAIGIESSPIPAPATDPGGASDSVQLSGTGSSSGDFTWVDGDLSPTQPNAGQTLECFVTGTKILTDNGYKLIEQLEIGNLVQTADGKVEPIKWIGRQTIKPNQIENPLRGYPILIKAGALGDNVPCRDLYVSPDHAFLIDGLLINAGALVNDTSIVKTEPTETFTYYQVELDNHSLLVAENAPAESYFPNKEDRLVYDNGAEYEELYPHGSNLMLWPMDYPRVSSKNKVPQFISQKLMQIAYQLEGENKFIQLSA